MELWDVYDAQRRPLGKTHRRGTPMPHGEYHLIAFVWIFNSRGQLLLTKRSPEKESFANQWETTGGAAVAGETSVQAIARELFEETGLRASAEEFVFLESVRSKSWICDTYALRKDAALSEIVLQPGETCAAKWVDRAEFESMLAAHEITQPDAQRYHELSRVFDAYFR